MMALAVDIGRDRAAERHEARARHHRREKSARQKNANDLIDRHARLGLQDAAFGIEIDHPVQPLEIDHPILLVECRVTVCASGSARDQLVRIGRDDRR